MEEMFDVYNENGEYLGVKSKSFCHREDAGVWHKPVWIWIVDKLGGGILVQKHDAGKKHFPNKYDIPSAGHVHAGEKPIEACVRETKEELGIDTKEDDFVFLTEWKFDIGWEFAQVYLLDIDASKAKFVLEEGKVGKVKWLSYKEFEKLIYSDEFCPHQKEFKDWSCKMLKKELAK